MGQKVSPVGFRVGVNVNGVQDGMLIRKTLLITY